VVEWFAKQPTPAFSLFGRRHKVPIASTGPDKLPALKKSIERLIELGHRRIVMILREEHRKPKPGFVAQALLDTLKEHGLPTGPYNLPDWENNPEDLRRCLDSLFHTTPPTALIIDEAFMLTVTQQYLARLGIIAPQKVSLICADPDPTFNWYSPTISHISWDSRKLVQQVVRWANNIARGKIDTREDHVKAEFIEGGTIGPVPRA
jgi:DNA-binding LacI/PurR family transcriptional regulator